MRCLGQGIDATASPRAPSQNRVTRQSARRKRERERRDAPSSKRPAHGQPEPRRAHGPTPPQLPLQLPVPLPSWPTLPPREVRCKARRFSPHQRSVASDHVHIRRPRDTFPYNTPSALPRSPDAVGVRLPGPAPAPGCHCRAQRVNRRRSRGALDLPGGVPGECTTSTNHPRPSLSMRHGRAMWAHPLQMNTQCKHPPSRRPLLPALLRHRRASSAVP